MLLPKIHPRASHAGDDSSDNQSIRCRSRSAHCTANLEDGQCCGDKPFHIERFVQSTDEENDGHRSHWEAKAHPLQILNLTQRLVDRSLDIGSDGSIESCIMRS